MHLKSHPFVWLWLLAAVSCASLPPPVPSRGGPHWLALETAHFTLYTDQSSERARATCQRLEQRLASLLAGGFQTHGELPLKLQVVLLDDHAEFEHFVGTEYFGGSARGLPLSPLVAITRETGSDSWRTLNFSIVDYVVAQSLGKPPLWLLMGLASYFESAYDSPDGRILIGAVPHHYAHWLRTHERMSAASVMTYDGPTDLSALYPSAWLITHYLMSKRGEQFAALQGALSEGRPFAQAWAQAFPQLSAAELDREIDRYAQDGAFPNFSLQTVAAPARVVGERELSDADVYALRAMLYAGGFSANPDAAAAARENVRLALEADPEQAQALALQAREHARTCRTCVR